MSVRSAPPVAERAWGSHELEPLVADITAGAVAARAAARRHRLQLLIALGDTAGVVASCLLAATALPWLGAAATIGGRYRFAVVASSAVLLVLVARGAHGAARRRIAPRVADDLGGLLAALFVAGICLLALRTIPVVAGWVPPGQVGVALGIAVVVVPTFREAALLAAARNPANVVRVVIVGAGTIADYLAVRLSRSRLVEVVGVVDEEPAPGRRLLGGVEDLPALCSRQAIDRVVIAFSGRHPAGSAAVLQGLRGQVDIDVVVRYYELANWESRLSDVTGLSLLNVGQVPGAAALAAKRVLDVAVSAVSLLALSPLLAVVALAIALESGRPVLFRQTRIGRGRRPFPILKFRTMSADDEEPGSALTRADGRPLPVRSPLETVPDPARITRIGRLLRRTGIDELPQLLNVLRGEMSLVGPRPFVPEECAGLHGTVERRFDVRPGMTGMWQVCGQHEVTFEELCRLDVQYATSWSLRGDLRILARTPARLVRGSAPGR